MFDANNMPILCQIAPPRFRATGYGLMNFFGIAAGGFCSLRLGNMRTLIIGAILQPIGIGAFALLGWHGGDYPLFAVGPVAVSAFQAASESM